MKKIVSMFLLFIVTGVFTACGSSEGDATSASGQSGKATASKLTKRVEMEDSGDINNAEKSKNLVVYFSHSGNTQVIANIIHKNVGGDIFQIETTSPYPQNYNQCTEVAKEEQQSNARPTLTRHMENMGAYDTIFIGYPNWWGTMPMAVFTFLEEYDLAGKRIVPFCTSEGSGLGRSVEDIKKTCPDSTILSGLTIRGGSAKTESAKKDVTQWLRDAGLLE